MKRIALLVIAGALGVVAEGAEDASSGAAYCARTAPEQSCRIGWTWGLEPRQFTWLEQFEPSSNSWLQSMELPAQRTGRNEAAAEDGRLYRVRSCDDNAALANCIQSTMVWSLLRPASINDVPKLMVFPNGEVAHLIKNGNYRDEVAIFNLHKLMLHLSGVEWSTLPAMTRVPSDKAKSDMWASIDEEISMNFMLARAEPRVAESERQPPESMEELTARRRLAIDGLGEEDMIIFGPSAAKYTVTVFLDVECKHCLQLYRDMKQVNDLGVRVRMLAYPQTGPDTPSWHKTESIWCASDRGVALSRLFDKRPLPPASCGAEQVTRQYALAKQLRIIGSPIILNERGEIVGGYASPQSLLQTLEQAAAKN